MQHTRSADDKTHSRTAGEISICGGGVGRSLFVAETDEADSGGETRFGDFDDGDADDAKDYVDVEGGEGRGD